MKIHRPLVLSAGICLAEIFEDGVYAEQAVDRLLKQPNRWGSRDRRFLAEAVYSVVRNKRLYDAILNAIESSNEKYYFKLLGIHLVVGGEALSDWEEWRSIEVNKVKEQLEILGRDPRLLYSVPDWIFNKGAIEFGEEQWLKELAALNEKAKVVIRVNTLKTNGPKLISLMREKGIELDVLPDSFLNLGSSLKSALVLSERKSVKEIAYYKKGFFEIQDAGSQLIAPFLDVKPGELVIDACAGGGGKTLHLADLMENKGKIIAMDVESYKLKNLEQRAKRAGLSIVETTLSNVDTIASLNERADALLLDVPCTGSGVLRRQVDTKWKLTEDKLKELVKLQEQLLINYSTMLKPAGKMVYATCSIFREENEELIEGFLKKMNGKFELNKQMRIHPSDGFDGFFMARMVKKF